MRRHPYVTGIFCIALLCCIFIAAVWSMGRLNVLQNITQGTSDKVAVVDVEGMITGSREIIEKIHALRDNDRIKAVVLRIDSPGGAVGPSQEIYEELIKLQELKPVVSSMGSVAASGGYYIAAATDKIFANPGTITGSIGVIIEIANIEELIGKIGLRSEVIKSGRYKDILSPTRQILSDERSLIQSVIDSIHGQFIDAVALGREMPREDVVALADGRIFSGEQAMKIGLVDELGNLYDAIRSAAEMAGIAGEPDVLYPEKKRPSLLEYLMESSLQRVFEGLRASTRKTEYLYMAR